MDPGENPHWLLDSRMFRVIIYLAIGLNAVQMGLATDYTGPGWDEVWSACEHGFTALFTTEMLIKMYFLRRAYFKDPWNQLDFFLVTLSIVDGWIMAPLMGGSGTGSL